MQLLVTDPTAAHASRKSLLGCNTLVLSACGIEADRSVSQSSLLNPLIKAELPRAEGSLV